MPNHYSVGLCWGNIFFLGCLEHVWPQIMKYPKYEIRYRINIYIFFFDGLIALGCSIWSPQLYFDSIFVAVCVSRETSQWYRFSAWPQRERSDSVLMSAGVWPAYPVVLRLTLYTFKWDCYCISFFTRDKTTTPTPSPSYSDLAKVWIKKKRDSFFFRMDKCRVENKQTITFDCWAEAIGCTIESVLLSNVKASSPTTARTHSSSYRKGMGSRRDCRGIVLPVVGQTALVP